MLKRLWQSFSATGLLLGTLFFGASLTPTLIPRTHMTEGVLSGSSFAIGYGLGVFWHWLWAYMELPQPRKSVLPSLKLVTAAVCGFLAGIVLWRTVGSQNSVRQLMGLEPISSTYALKVAVIAIATFLALIGLGRLFRFIIGLVSRRSRRFVPPRLSNVIGVVVAAILFWTMANGVFFRFALHVLYSSYEQYDALIEPNRAQPSSPLKTGSVASLLEWNELGRAGRAFVASGPSAAEIGAFTGNGAPEPIRVYVGLRAAETVTERAKLALAELKRVGAFDRSALVIITPTGTGWVDPAAMDSVEYLHGGDVASVVLEGDLKLKASMNLPLVSI